MIGVTFRAVVLNCPSAGVDTRAKFPTGPGHIALNPEVEPSGLCGHGQRVFFLPEFPGFSRRFAAKKWLFLELKIAKP